MFVNDTQEYIVDTSGCRFSSEPCGCPLNSRERSGSVCIFKPCAICAICVGLSDGEMFKLPDVLYKKVCIPLGDYKQTAGSHSEKSMPTGKLMGIRKFDKVKCQDQELFVKGRMSTGYAVLMDIEGKPVDLKPMAKLKTVTRISARTSCLTSQIPIENFPSNVNTESVYFSKKNLVSL